MGVDRYIYLLLDLYLLVLVGIIAWKRKDLRLLIIKSGIAGGILGLLSEFWYFKDYWTPPSSLGIAVYSPEDFFFGFAIAALAATLYPFLFRKSLERMGENHKIFVILVSLIGAILFFFGTQILTLNSVFVSELLFLLFALAIIRQRTELFIPSIVSGLSLLILIIPIYTILFHYVSPHYVSEYFIVSRSSQTLLIGGVPSVEWFWYFCWGCFASIGYEFYSGKRLVAFRRHLR